MSMIHGLPSLYASFDSLRTKLRSSEVLEFATEKRANRMELKKWEDMLQNIQLVLMDAESKQLKDSPVKIWLEHLQLLAYDMDDILDVFATESLKRKLMRKQQAGTSKLLKLFSSTGCTSSSGTAFKLDIQMMPNIKKITLELEDLANMKSQLRFTNLLPNPTMIIREPTLESVSFVDETNVFGREEEQEKILDLLLTDNFDDDGAAVIPIVGMGGIGKTTLAQLLYNDDNVRVHFELRAWVCVSDDFDVTRITKSILESITTHHEAYGPTDLSMLQLKLKDKLTKKRFLLVLDDVWNVSYADWAILRSPFAVGAPGSKILVTTRSQRVSQLMGTVTAHQLQPISEQVCFSMFTYYALGARDFSGYPHLKEIGKEIVKRCNGLPLAARVLGGILRNNLDPEVWMSILKSEMFTLADGGIIPALRLSYHHLPPRLKQCFAYCSIFPVDYEFREEDMALLWMAEGFLPEATNKMEMENLGRQYFKDLVAGSFFQISSMDESRFVMHDLIRDLARSVAGTICFTMEGERLMEVPEHIRHLSYDSALSAEFKNFKPPKSLRTFIPFILPQNIYHCIPNNILLDLLPKLRSLRVLSLREFSMSKLPDSIGNLRHLRYLDFCHSEIKSLPDSVCALHNLQTLLLRQCRNLEKLPSKIGNLVNLHHLDITGAFSFRGMPIQIGELTNLQTLLAPDGHCIRPKDLLNLEGGHPISGLENIVTTEDALEASLGDKVGLRWLKIKWSEKIDHKRPEELIIEDYDGIVFPNWLADPSFSSLLSLEIKNCKSCTSMPSTRIFPCLRELSVMTCPKLLGKLPIQLPSLEKLVIHRCNQLVVSISRLPMLHQLEIDGCKTVVHESSVELSSLKKVSLSNISELTCLPERLMFGLTKVESLKIDGCQELTSLWKNKWEALAHIGSLKDLVICNCPKLVPFGLGADEDDEERLNEEEEERQRLGMPCSINYLNLSSTSCKLLKVSRIFTSLWELRIENCPQLVSFSEESFPVTLKRLVVRLCKNLLYFLKKGKYVDVRNVSHLEDLNIEKCPSLKALSSRCDLPIRLQKLHIDDCPKLASLSYSGKLPVGLRRLHISNCPELNSISGELPLRLQSLQIWYCLKLTALSPTGMLPEGLKHLQISNCPKLKSIAEMICDYSPLEYIGVIGCINIQSLPQGLDKLSLLKEIVLIYCPSLSLPESWLPSTNLRVLHIDACEKFQAFPNNFHNLTSLEELEMSNCPFPMGFPATLKSLSILSPKEFKPLKEWGLDNLACLEQPSIEGGYPDMVSFPPEELQMMLPISLVQLTIKDFPGLKSLSSRGFKKLTSLKYLTIMDCPKVRSLPSKDALPRLSRLHIDDCPLLRRHCKINGLEWSKISHIPYVRIDDILISAKD